jgi:hypothetical protein
MSNDGPQPQAWKLLQAESVSNVYLLEGGVNNWIQVFGAGEQDIQLRAKAGGPDELAYVFPAALGARYEAADPNPHEWSLDYEPKIKLQRKRSPSGGGCG